MNELLFVSPLSESMPIALDVDSHRLCAKLNVFLAVEPNVEASTIRKDDACRSSATVGFHADAQ